MPNILQSTQAVAISKPQTWFSYREYCKYFTGLVTLFTRSVHVVHPVCSRCSPDLFTQSLEAMAPHPVVLLSIDDKIVKESFSAKYRDIIKRLVKPTTRIRSTPSISPRRSSSKQYMAKNALQYNKRSPFRCIYSPSAINYNSIFTVQSQVTFLGSNSWRYWMENSSS